MVIKIQARYHDSLLPTVVIHFFLKYKNIVKRFFNKLVFVVRSHCHLIKYRDAVCLDALAQNLYYYQQ